MSPCEAVTASLADGDALSASLRPHLAACPGCAALVLLDDHLTHVPGESPRSHTLEPSAELRAVMAAPLGPTAGYSALRRAVAPVVAALGLAAGIAVLHPRPDLTGQSTGFWLQAGVFLLVSVLGVSLVLARGPRGLGVTPRARWAFALASVALFEALALTVSHAGPGTVLDPASVGAGLHLHCALVGSGYALVVLAVILWAGRRGAAVSPTSAGLAGGLAAGLAAALGLQLVCPVGVPLHLAVGHGAAILVAGVSGVLAGRRVLVP